jgi:hypothetical protein
MIGVYNPHNLRIIYRYCSILLALSLLFLSTRQAIVGVLPAAYVMASSDQPATI